MEKMLCALIGYEIQPNEIEPITSTTIKYETEFVGKVHITLPAYQELIEGEFERYLIAGICKNRTLKGEEPVLIDSEFIRTGFAKLNPPTEFEEKCSHFLRYLYEFGGRENKEFEIYTTRMFPVAYADVEEFSRIIDQLESDRYITIRTKHNMSRDKSHKYLMGVKMTGAGKAEARKGMPKMPMFGLVSQAISTGQSETDEKINHARQLFFDEPRTMDKMRSACESLSFVLEPLRTELSAAFSTRDVSDFFQIVNTFDIRHNKDNTKSIVHEEQLEWVFYTLLNSINTFVKMKNNGKI